MIASRNFARILGRARLLALVAAPEWQCGQSPQNRSIRRKVGLLSSVISLWPDLIDPAASNLAMARLTQSPGALAMMPISDWVSKMGQYAEILRKGSSPSPGRPSSRGSCPRRVARNVSRGRRGVHPLWVSKRTSPRWRSDSANPCDEARTTRALRSCSRCPMGSTTASMSALHAHVATDWTDQAYPTYDVSIS